MNPWALLTESQHELTTRLAPQKIAPPAPTPPKRKRPEYLNPWKITPAEERALNAVIETGRGSDAAKALGVSQKTLEVHLVNIKKKMNLPSRIHVLIHWDRWNRE